VDSGGSRELTTIASCSPYFSALLVDESTESQVMVVIAASYESHTYAASLDELT
jgi:hypothetical protein